jgi:hypothetical protein
MSAYYPAVLSQPGDVRLKIAGLGGHQIEGFVEELARRPGVVI